MQIPESNMNDSPQFLLGLVSWEKINQTRHVFVLNSGQTFIPSLEQDMQIPSVPLKRLPFLAKRAQSRWSREGDGANYLDGEREPVHWGARHAGSVAR